MFLVKFQALTINGSDGVLVPKSVLVKIQAFLMRLKQILWQDLFLI